MDDVVWYQPGKDEPPWIGVDLDGTLAHYDHGTQQVHIGDPVQLMLNRVNQWLEDGYRVKIMTARVSRDPDYSEFERNRIWKWCEKIGLPKLEVTCTKDYHMLELYDDRAVTVEANTGKLLAPSSRNL